MRLIGSCHCARIAYEVQGEPQRVMACRCAFCTRQGVLRWSVPRAHWRLHTAQQNLSAYRIAEQPLTHYFCPICGCLVFSAQEGDEAHAMVSLNARCLEEVDVSCLAVSTCDDCGL